MKNKLLFIIIILVFISIDETKAQSSGNVSLSVTLADVRSIKINPAQSVVQLNFSTAEDYANGVNLLQNAHLEITSSGGFLIKVKAASQNLINGVNTIPVSTIKVTPTLSAVSNQTGNLTSGIYMKGTWLSNIPKAMIDAPLGGSKLQFDVNYQSLGGPDYTNKSRGNYSTTITYSIEPN